MANIVSFLRWGWLLIIALFIPISLPVGGAQKDFDDLWEPYAHLHVTAGNLCEFRSAPYQSSKILRTVDLSTPMQILRVWKSPSEGSWLHVQITSFPVLEVNAQAQRGWIQI